MTFGPIEEVKLVGKLRFQGQIFYKHPRLKSESDRYQSITDSLAFNFVINCFSFGSYERLIQVMLWYLNQHCGYNA